MRVYRTRLKVKYFSMKYIYIYLPQNFNFKAQSEYISMKYIAVNVATIDDRLIIN